ncbi:FAD-binding and (Fe-S)-binding domain-containing protein [Pseudonocardia alaniniphila]|uniref:FAD-binding oxidoreductase n=1 Tax=Pseudonocardia alaniniphila TaxID=75291 RepID=A0ABS9TMB0_9PSEU|nr:FAD-binding and (Fe-S)-binding domain-containing protein [Pseudonocardia alaniniphila]MCH6169672.1 FAD-binding oxidoreductase [Pseudonocardia alaniniphila]
MSTPHPTSSDTSDLHADLAKAVRGPVRFDTATRAMYSADASNYRRVPIGLVTPLDPDDVEAAVSVCSTHGVPVLPRGAGTSIAGQAVNTAVVLDFTKHLNRVLEIDPEARTARVQPGLVLDALRDAARPHGLTFGPDPSTHNRCTLGGMIGNNACGSHSVAWGKTVDNVHALDVLTYRGEYLQLGRGVPATGRVPDALRKLAERAGDGVRASFPDLTRRVSGYNLDQLLPEKGFDLARAVVGTEGTCVTVLEATVRLVESPPVRALAVLGFPDAYLAADHVTVVRDLRPLTIEGMDAGLIAALRAHNPAETASRTLPEGGGWLYVETGGATRAEAEAAAHAVVTAMKPYGATSVVVSDPAAMKALWRIREDGAGIVTRSPDGGEAWPGWEDAAVPPERFGAYLREFDALLSRHRRRGAYYGHFGDGCLHIRIDFDLASSTGIADFRSFMEDAADLAVAHGGSLSGEHGDGAARAELLPRMYPPEIIAAFEEFKGVWDPDDRMNPGRVVRPAKLDEDLRVFVGMPTLPDEPVLAFGHDRGSFTRATRRCLGVGKCITDHGGVMCPSYRATGEEMHSTRGRARLLFEMASGEVVTGGWQSPEVAEALDMCLSCKGCKRDCPVGVDMAAYKTEFLAQRYRRKLRPASHYSMGALPRWLLLVGWLPARMVDGLNAAGRGRLGALAKRVGGIDPQRAIPPIARRRYTGGRRSRRHAGAANASRGRLLLWPDTFTNHFDPTVAADAVAVLERLGYAVELPPREVCCGLTWTSTGQVDTARRVLRRSLRTVEPWLLEGVPVVGLEPSCTAALRADAAELLPGDPLAGLAATGVRTFAELLAEHADELRDGVVTPGLRALVQVHCHQHAELGTDDDRAVMAALGVEAEVLDSGCCGLAGNFGFEKGHYDVSMACAERVLLPAVRAADPAVAVVADGFSCRTQLRQAGTREPVHLAQLAAHALGLTPTS